MNTTIFKILLSGIFVLAGAITLAEAQTHGLAFMEPAIEESTQSTNGDTVAVIANLSVDSLRLVVGLEEMPAHIRRMASMGKKAGFMWMDLNDTHIIGITVHQQQRLITDQETKIALKVFDPAAKSEMREMAFVQGLDSFNEGVNLTRKGKYDFMLLLQHKGQARRAEFSYVVK